MPDSLVNQLEVILADFSQFKLRSRHSDCSDCPEHDRQSLVTRSIAAIRRIAGPSSHYAQEAARIQKGFPHLHQHMIPIVGVVQALRDDVNAGYVSSVVELAHGEVFADFLEMAEHLLSSGYKDAAAVISGSTLEGHLRALCAKHGVPATETVKGSVVVKKADRINSELAASSVYSRLDQKAVTAWLDLRNKAAHGCYSDYAKEQVSLHISGIRDFITRHPA